MAPLLTFDEARFAHETIDGETMIIDTIRGHLIIAGGGGSFILECIRGGTSRDNLLHEIAGRYGHEYGASAQRFVDELMAAGVLTETERGRESSRLGPHPVPPNGLGLGWPTRLAPPVIERYEDIAEIIAMDPIHDVDASGWPRKIV